jgi:hypothetical protein
MCNYPVPKPPSVASELSLDGGMCWKVIVVCWLPNERGLKILDTRNNALPLGGENASEDRCLAPSGLEVLVESNRGRFCRENALRLQQKLSKHQI